MPVYPCLPLSNKVLVWVMLSVFCGSNATFFTIALNLLEICIIMCADHGPCVSGAHNAIVTARAGKDLVSCLVLGIIVFNLFTAKYCQGVVEGWYKTKLCSCDSLTDKMQPKFKVQPSTSRGTQRLYIRLNTLLYLLTHINSLEKTLSKNPVVLPSTRQPYGNHCRSYNNGSYFEKVLSSLLTACKHVAEVAAYRLIFLDFKSVFYESLYVGDAANAKIRLALRTLKQNITLMTTLLTDKAQSLALKEVMKASFEAFLMVLLASGNSMAFTKSDYHIMSEDFESLNRVNGHGFFFGRVMAMAISHKCRLLQEGGIDQTQTQY
ncbi:hypothetical protein AHAS_Ahas02G0161200 [Arachis hypogaea]